MARTFTYCQEEVCFDDFAEDDVDDPLDVAVVKVLVGFRDLLNELGFDHRPASHPRKVIVIAHLSAPCQTETKPSRRKLPSP